MKRASLKRTPFKSTAPGGLRLAATSSRICEVCKAKPTFNSMASVCGQRCAIKKGKLDKAAAKKDLARRKEALKSRSEWLADTQREFNAYVRKRDEQDPCISCGNTREKSKYNAGHYLSVGAHPELRFHEDNCHKQCEYCNTYLSGNIAAYRPQLIAKIGIERVEWLEGPHEAAKYTIDDAKAIRATYKQKLKDLNNG